MVRIGFKDFQSSMDLQCVIYGDGNADEKQNKKITIY